MSKMMPCSSISSLLLGRWPRGVKVWRFRVEGNEGGVAMVADLRFLGETVRRRIDTPACIREVKGVKDMPSHM